MFGFGVGFGVGEFGVSGYAIEASDALVTMVGETEMSAQGDVIIGNIAFSSWAQIMANSSLTIDPSGVNVTAKKPRRASTASPVVTAKPTSMQTMRTVAQIPKHIYHINRDPNKRER